MDYEFIPRAVSEVKYLIVALDYIASGQSMESIARKYHIGLTTVWRYAHHISEVDSRLGDLINYKVKVVKGITSLDAFTIAPALKAHLEHVIANLGECATLPEDVSSYIWDEYVTKKCNH